MSHAEGVRAQYARLAPQTHELEWVVCPHCNGMVPAVNMGTLPEWRDRCRSCAYGEGFKHLADVPNMLAVIAAVIRHRNRSLKGARGAEYRHQMITGGSDETH